MANMSGLACEPCNVTFKSDSERQKHLRNEFHLKNVQRFRSRNQQVFVKGFDPRASPKDLEDYFSQFAKVTSVYIDKRRNAYAFVEFSSEFEAKQILTLPHMFWGRQLVVKKAENPSPIPQNASVSCEELVPILSQCSTVEEQFKVFCEKVCLTPEDIRNRISICTEMESLLRKYYPDCKVHIFGSTLNGFGFKGCDVDMLFEPSPDYWEFSSCTSDSLRKDITLNAVDQGIVSLDDLLHMPSNQQVFFLHKVLRKNALFRRPLHIPARCPIVKFTHKRLSVECDVSCSSRLVLANTQLLLTYSKLDKRVMPLMMLLRYWGKLREIIRVNSMSSYAFSMMVLFFLQTRAPPVVPSVMELRSLAGMEDKRIINTYDCSFCTNPKKVEPSKNRETLEELLLEFFKFYASFDYSYVVSPLMGQKMGRDTYHDLDEDEEHSFKTSVLAIQDPLECDRNVTAFMTLKVFYYLKEMMEIAAASLEGKISPNSNETDGSCFGILNILKELEQKQPPLCVVPNPELLPPPSLGLMFTLMFSPDFKDCLADSRNIELISATIRNVFDYSLGFDTEVVDKYYPAPISVPPSRKRHTDSKDNTPSPAKKQCVDGDANGSLQQAVPIPETPQNAQKSPSYFPDTMLPQLLISIQCIVEHNVWSQRPKIKRRHSSKIAHYGKGKGVEMEQHVTSLVTEAGRIVLQKPIFFSCDCYMYRDQACDRLIFIIKQFEPFTSASEFRSLSNFLKGLITDILNDAVSAGSH